MELDPKDVGVVSKILTVVASGAAGLAIAQYKLSNLAKKHDRLEQRVGSLEELKVSKAYCEEVQARTKDKFVESTTEFKELKAMIKESNELHQRHHDDLVKIVLENLRQ
jgi:transcription initiation factor IIF auxiliary subunit